MKRETSAALERAIWGLNGVVVALREAQVLDTEDELTSTIAPLIKASTAFVDSVVARITKDRRMN